ncbi:MAG: M15 family metallopeptidase, partial [Oscillospiraceae bacterium]|nr:M15 family metallopeptidase [Candidatus Equicaccousia limihippi]
IILCAVFVLAAAGCAPTDDESTTIDVESIAVPLYDASSEASGSSEPTASKINLPASSKSTNGGNGVSSPTYIKGVLIVNKSYGLPASYAPGVDATAKSWLNKMFAAADKDGLDMWIASGYRSYQRQTQLYNNYVSQDGKAAADRYSARPGFSEHQTGLAFDINDPSDGFKGTDESKWLAAHCHEYGFIIRYPQSKECVTGFMYEPWHVRYVGTELAKQLHASGQCLEEYLGVDSKYAD